MGRKGRPYPAACGETLGDCRAPQFLQWPVLSARGAGCRAGSRGGGVHPTCRWPLQPGSRTWSPTGCVSACEPSSCRVRAATSAEPWSALAAPPSLGAGLPVLPGPLGSGQRDTAVSPLGDGGLQSKGGLPRGQASPLFREARAVPAGVRLP